MSTKFYLSNKSSVANFNSTYAWTNFSGYSKCTAFTGKNHTGESLVNRSMSITDSGWLSTYLNAVFISDPLAAQTISGGSYSGQLQGYAFGTGLVLSPIAHVQVINSTGGYVWDVQYSNAAEPFTTSMVNRYIQKADFSSFTVHSGDRLVIEIGAEISDIVSGHSDVFFTEQFGVNVGYNDLPVNDTSTGNLLPWVQFSPTIQFL